MFSRVVQRNSLYIVFVKKPWRILLVLSAMVLVFVLWPASKEPEYRGTRLSRWLFQSYYPRDRKVSDEADHALMRIGTNAIPCLLQWMQYQPGPWRMRIDAVRLQLAPKFRESKTFAGAFRDWDEFKGSAASYGFRILGDSASSAVPELTGIAKRAPSWEVSIRAMQSLQGIGSSGLAGLISIAGDTSLDSKRRITAINLFPQTPAPTIRQSMLACLVECSADRDAGVAAMATHSLGVLHIAPELSLPAISKAYGSPHASVRVRAVSALGEFGPQAATATNVLAQALNDPDTRIQDAARTALARVMGTQSAAGKRADRE